MTTNKTVLDTMLINSNDGHEKVARYESRFLPRFGEFQLLGDGTLVRFADQILLQYPGISHGTRAVGYCVNGQRIDQLRHRIKTKSHPLSTKVLILIGTTDILCGSNIYKMTKNFNALLDLLKKNTEKILILTLPPIPRLSVTYFHWTLIRQFNSFLKSLDDGLNIIVADICPLFTKFKGVLEYDISIARERQNEPIRYVRKRKSLLNRRRKCMSERRKLNDKESDKSESDYRNTTDTNTSIDSEILSSELSQEKENHRSIDILDEAEDTQVQSGNKKDSESPARFVVRTLQSVFGKDMLNRKNKTEDKSTLHAIKQPEKRPRNGLFDLYDSDYWEVQSDEDSMSEHVYKSQEETEYDVVEIGRQRKKKKCGEFSKFVESLNENQSIQRKGFQYRKWKRDCSRNEKPETTESSSSSDTDLPKKHICSFVDDNFRHFLEKSWSLTKENDCPSHAGSCYPHVNIGESFNEMGKFSISQKPFSSNTESQKYDLKSSRKLFLDSRGYKTADGTSKRDNLLIHLASKICYLECYEIFYSFGKKRMNMVNLNRQGLMELKNFLICNNYV